MTSIQKAEAFANAAEDFVGLVVDRAAYRTLLLDIAADGLINHPERREAAERMRENLEDVLV